MIICSCNVLSEHQVRCALAKATEMRMSQVYARLGSSAQCGRCAHTIREIMGSKSRSGERPSTPQRPNCFGSINSGRNQRPL